MNISEIKQAIADAFDDVAKLTSVVQEAVPALEAAIPAVGAEAPEISAALDAAKATQGAIGQLLTTEGIDTATHDALQARVGAVIEAVPSVTTPAPPAPEPPAAPSAVAALILFAFLLLGLSAQAQTTQVPNLITNNPSFLDGLKTMEQAVTSGTNWTFIGGYGHSLKGNNNLAFGDVAYDFNDNVGVVVGYDALRGSGVSQYNSLKGGVTLKTQIYPLAWTGIAKLAAIEGQPFAGDLIATARDGSVGNIVTTGINFNVYSFSRYVVDVGAQYELRAGEGVFNGNYALIHVGISRSF